VVSTPLDRFLQNPEEPILVPTKVRNNLLLSGGRVIVKGYSRKILSKSKGGGLWEITLAPVES
jgi:hypothetical protein